MLVNILPYANYASSKLWGIEILRSISDTLILSQNKNKAILSYIIPHLISLVEKEEKSLVKAKLIEVFVHCLKKIEGDSIDPIDYRIFQDYIMPNLLDNYFREDADLTGANDQIIELTLTKHIGDIVMAADQFKYMTQVSISENMANGEFWGELSIEQRKYLESILNDDVNYAQDFIKKAFMYWIKPGNHLVLLEFCKNLTKIYYGIGKKSFEKFILPNFKDFIINGNTNILYELLKSMNFLPLKSEIISPSLDCYENIEKDKGFDSISTYLDPLTAMLFKTCQNGNNEEFRKSQLFSLCSYMKITDLFEESKMTTKDYEAFVKAKVSKKVYEFFGNDKLLLFKAKLETLETVVFLFNLIMEDYQLEDQHIEKLKVT
jgi:hypothetical protein